MATRKNGRNTDGTFARGNSGRPTGARNKATLAIQELLEGSTEALTHMPWAYQEVIDAQNAEAEAKDAA
jgi:hypothetical protein